MDHHHARYEVSFKLLLRRDDRFLVLVDTVHGKIDFPGGRTTEDEYETPLIEILHREVREELGEEVRYEIGRPILQFRRHFPSAHVFLTLFEGTYVSGEMKISDEHQSGDWMRADEILAIDPSRFFSPEEYQALKAYLEGR